MAKTNIPPIPNKGFTVYKHKKETVKHQGKTYPRFMVMKPRAFANLNREFRAKWDIYQEFGQPDPNQKKVDKPPIPKQNNNNGAGNLSEQKESQGKGQNEQESLGGTESKDKVETKTGEGDTGSSGEATNTNGEDDQQIKATDAAKKLALDKEIDLSVIKGTGKDGIITVGDVKSKIAD